MIGVAFAAARVAGAQPATPTALPSAQSLFDAGQAELDQRKFADAERTFAGLEARLAASAHPQARSIAVARLRRAQALVHLGDDGRASELFVAALPALETPADGGLKAEALLGLGEADERGLDLTAAAERYRAALALVPADDAVQRVALRMRIARTATFDDPARVAADLAAGLPEATRALAASKPAMAAYMDIYGRAQLNSQQIKPARASLKQALALSGGLTLKVNLSMLEMRGDAAIAAELDHDDSGAAEFLAYTGAGQSEKVSLRIPPDVDPPACGDTIRPDDVAVVQFSLADDGAVSFAQPIYASRSGQMAVEFARAVRQWRWDPKAAQAIDPFFRIAARLEMRCTTRADKISAGKLLMPYVREWVQEQPVGNDASFHHGPAWVASLRARIDKEQQRPTRDSALLVGLIQTLAAQPEVDAAETRALLDRAAAMAEAANAPLAVRAMLAVKRSDFHEGGSGFAPASHRAAALAALADDPAYANDPRIVGWLKLMAAERAAQNRHLVDARTLLETVVGLPENGFPADDPVRRAAAIRLASLQTATGARDQAVATFRKSGLDPSQCALLDETPLVRSRNSSSGDYPDVARRLGFEGWTVTEFDVTNAGRTANPRALIAYPPFLFGSSSTAIVGRSLYQPTFRPNGALSCGGYRDRVLFKQPNG